MFPSTCSLSCPVSLKSERAKTHDSNFARELCAGLKDGEIVVWDKAYNDFKHLAELTKRGVFRVNRAKDNMTCEVVREVSAPKGKITRDVAIRRTHLKMGEIILKIVHAGQRSHMELPRPFQPCTFLWDSGRTIQNARHSGKRIPSRVFTMKPVGQLRGRSGIFSKWVFLKI